MVTANTVNQSGSKPTAHKAKLSTVSRIRSHGSNGAVVHHSSSSVNRSIFKAATSHPSLQPPLLRDSHRYIAEEMDQQRQDHGSNDIRHYDYEDGRSGGGREGSPADEEEEVRDEFPMESYLGGGSGHHSTVPVLSNHGLLPYPNSNNGGAAASAPAASAAAAAAGNSNAPGLEGDLNNLIIDSQNSWDVLNQNDSFGFDFNKGGEMSLSFESHDYNVLDQTAVTESMDGDTNNNSAHQQQTIDWATVAPQLDMHGNLIPPTSTTTTTTGSSGGGMGMMMMDSRNDNGQNYHHLVDVGGTAGEGGMRDDPFAYAFGAGPNNHHHKSSTKKSTSSSRKGTRKGGVGASDGNGNGKKKKGRGAKSKKSQRDHSYMGPNPVPSFYSGNYHGDVPQLVSSSSNTSWQHDAHQGGYSNMPHSSSSGGGNDYNRPPPYHHSHSNKGGRSNAQSRTSSRDGGPPRFISGAALLTTESGIVLTREQAPGIGWPPNEDLALQEVMARHKSPINWEVVAKEMNFGRLARECHDRWTRYLKPGTRKGQWKEEEDAIVLRVIATSSEHPFTQWADLAPMLPGRSGKQIRDRWVNYLNPAINHLPFSREDDLKLWAGHRELGKRWVEISVKIFNSTRSENHIKNRWYSAAFKKFIANEFGNCAYVDASPSFGSASNNDAATATSGAVAAHHHMPHKGM